MTRPPMVKDGDMTDHETNPVTLLHHAARSLHEAHQPCGPIPIQLHTTHMIGIANVQATLAVGHLLHKILNHLESRVTDDLGTDWEAKRKAAGCNARRQQPETYTIADGTAVRPRDGHVTDADVWGLLEGE